MPIPFILGAGAAIAAAAGTKKAVDAKNDTNEAKSLNQKATLIAQNAEKNIEQRKKRVNTSIENLGRKKIEVLTTTITEFVENFEKIKSVELLNSDGIDELRNLEFDNDNIIELKAASLEAKKVACNGIAAVGSGALLAYGTYSAVMSGAVGAVASTGTAIGTLSGVAATNATLAWLGGGSLAAGGFGMAGGMVVLGGLVAGPALAVGGVLLASQAKKALNNAYSNVHEAEIFAKQSEGICITLDEIALRTNQIKSILDRLNFRLVSSINDLKIIIETQGTDYSTYKESSKKKIYKLLQIVQVVKMILDTPILSDDGNLTAESKITLKNAEQQLALRG